MIDFTKASAQLRRRNASETRFQWFGRLAIAASLLFLVVMVGSIAWQAKSTVLRAEVALTVDLGPDNIDPADIEGASYGKLYKKSLRAMFPDVKKRKDKKALYGLVSVDAGFEIRNAVLADPSLLGETRTIWVSSSGDLALYAKGQVDRSLPEDERRLSDKELAWIDQLDEQGQIRQVLNWAFFTTGDSREPELAGILSALTGSALTLLVCFVVSFPIAVLSAIYLEEFAPKNRLSSLIEVNINNLAAVPSIVFGLLGLAVFLNTFQLPIWFLALA